MFKGRFEDTKRLSLADLSQEKRGEIVKEMKRWWTTRKRMPLRCPDRRCRRHRVCQGADFACLNAAAPPPMSNRERKRMRGDFRRNSRSLWRTAVLGLRDPRSNAARAGSLQRTVLRVLAGRD